MSQALYSTVYDAAQVRLTEFGEHLLEREADDLPTEHVVGQLLDLNQGLETAARLPLGADQDAVLGDLIERYALGAVGTDPFLRAQLPPVPTAGATVRRFVLGVNGKAVGVNSKLVGVGAALVPVTGPPVFNTTVLPGLPIGALTYTGDAGSTFEFDMPMSASTGGPQVMLLYVAGMQVGRVDFPLALQGNYFRLNRAGVPYLGTFQAVAAPFHVTLQPE